jgi:peroxiredoxin
MKKGVTVENFELQNSDGEKVRLDELLKKGKILVLFFPLAFSSVCTDEMCTTRDNMKMYNSLNVQVIGISVDSFFTLQAFKKANNINFTLLSDFNKEVSEMFGVLDQDFFGMKGVSKRSAFVINQDHTIEYAEVLDDSGQLPDFKEIQKAIV